MPSPVKGAGLKILSSLRFVGSNPTPCNMLFSGRFGIDTRFIFVGISILVAIVLHVSGMDMEIATYVKGMGMVGGLLVGAFYTFGITTPSAFIIILEMMAMNGAFATAIAASLSAAFVDMVLFYIIREQLEKSTVKILAKMRERTRAASIAFPVVGFLIFGLPIPDEIGLAMMGITTIKPTSIFAIAFLSKLMMLLISYGAFSSILI